MTDDMPSRIFATGWNEWYRNEGDRIATPYIRATDRLALAEALGLVDAEGKPTARLENIMVQVLYRGIAVERVAAIIAGPEEAE